MKEHLVRYAELENQIKALEVEQNGIKLLLKNEADQTPNHILDYGIGGCVLQNAVRETLDKKEVRKLIGDIEYKRIAKETKYEVFKVYANEESWNKYKAIFSKGGELIETTN